MSSRLILLFTLFTICTAEPLGKDIVDRLKKFSNTATAKSPTARFPYELSVLEFTIELHRALLLTLGGLYTDENVIFSPISITSVLNMILVGSNANTEREIRHALQYADYLTEPDTNHAYRRIIGKLLKEGRGVDVTLANRIFLQQEFPVYEDYLNKTEKVFQAGMEAIDFSRSFNARQRVNDWVNSTTRGNIPELIKQQLSPLTIMIIANAIHFKGAWQFPFSEGITTNMEFKIRRDDTVKVPMMIHVLDVPYVESDTLNCSMIGLPYKGTQFGLFIILPDGEGLNALIELEQNLNGNNLMSLIRKMKPTSTSIKIPRLKEETTTNLRSALRQMGINDLFSTSRSDLSRISNRRTLRLDDIMHQAKIVVNEEGTEASAGTAITFTRGGTSKFFTVNKPFLYFIRDNLTGMPLFFGRVVRPSTALPFSGR